MTPTSLPVFDADILCRVVAPSEPTLPEDSARSLLDLRFSDDDLARMTHLAEKNQSGELSEQEREELAGFLRVGHFLDLMRAKALASLQGRQDR